MATELEIEMNPLTKSGRSQSKWSKIFVALAQTQEELDIPLSIGGSGSSLIELEKLKSYIKSEGSFKLEKNTGIPKRKLLLLVKQLEDYADKNHDGKITLKEWETYLKSKEGGNFFKNHKIVHGIAQIVSYAPTVYWCPPPLFIILITCLQILFYLLCIFAPETMGVVHKTGTNSWLTCSYFIYNPNQRREAWRFVSYMFLHASNQHIIFNLVIQLVVGLPLELSQQGWIGSLRIAGLYMAGVIVGSLGASVVEAEKYLVGASGGVYALIFAHLATLILNWKEDGIIYQAKIGSQNDDGLFPMELNPWIRGFRLAFIILFTAADVGQTVYNYVIGASTTTSIAGHAFGAVAGCMTGIFLLENRKVEDWEVIFKWILLGLFGLILCTLVLWHIAGTSFDFFLPEIYYNGTQPNCKISL